MGNIPEESKTPNTPYSVFNNSLMIEDCDVSNFTESPFGLNSTDQNVTIDNRN